MPVMGGLEALRKIRAIDPEAQVIVVTALDQKQALMDSIRDGAIDFIVKPFERQRVLSLLHKLGADARIEWFTQVRLAEDKRPGWRNLTTILTPRRARRVPDRAASACSWSMTRR